MMTFEERMEKRLVELRKLCPTCEPWQIHYVLTRFGTRKLDPTGEFANWLQAKYQIPEPEEPAVPLPLSPNIPEDALTMSEDSEIEEASQSSEAPDKEIECDWFIHDHDHTKSEPREARLDDITHSLSDFLL